MNRPFFGLALAVVLGLGCGAAACSSTTSTSNAAPDAGAGAGDDTSDASLSDTGGADGKSDADAAIDKSAACASTFGTELTNAFGRLDGTVLAIVKPTDQQCAMPNSTHVVLQVTMHGAAYRMVVNVMSDFGGSDTRVRYAMVDGPTPPGDAWAEGWHTGTAIDYVATLGLHSASTAFQPYDIGPLADAVTAAIPLGAHVSVFATSSGGASAHLVHRNDGATDGAIVLDPDGAHPKWMAFHFLEQTF